MNSVVAFLFAFGLSEVAGTLNGTDTAANVSAPETQPAVYIIEPDAAPLYEAVRGDARDGDVRRRIELTNAWLRQVRQPIGS